MHLSKHRVRRAHGREHTISNARTPYCISHRALTLLKSTATATHVYSTLLRPQVTPLTLVPVAWKVLRRRRRETPRPTRRDRNSCGSCVSGRNACSSMYILRLARVEGSITKPDCSHAYATDRGHRPPSQYQPVAETPPPTRVCGDTPPSTSPPWPDAQPSASRDAGECQLHRNGRQDGDGEVVVQSERLVQLCQGRNQSAEEDLPPQASRRERCRRSSAVARIEGEAWCSHTSICASCATGSI